MKIFIQSNKYQLIAAKVAKFSFERFNYDVEIMNFENYEILKKNLNNTILRNGKVTTFKDDLQSFTLLRFLAPQLNNYNDLILIIDPDIFALKNPIEIFEEINENHNIYCTYYNNKPRSEMMLIDASKIRWNFNEIINDLFNHKLDYSDLINLNFDKNLKIKELKKKFNSHDKIINDTIMLHTTKRITQPWKEGLDINFERTNFTYFQILKEKLKKIINMKYNEELIAKKFLKHPDENVIKIVKKLFIDAKNLGYLSQEEIDEEIKRFNLSNKIFEKN